jgi:hypothetical protein
MKVAFVILGILVCAFFLSGFVSPASSTWLEGLAGWLAPKFDPRDIVPGCYSVSAASFQATPVCVARISASDARYRFLKLSSGVRAAALFTPAARDSGITYRQQNLLPGESQTVVVPAAGGSLTLTCQGVGACAIHAQ